MRSSSWKEEQGSLGKRARDQTPSSHRTSVSDDEDEAGHIDFEKGQIFQERCEFSPTFYS